MSQPPTQNDHAMTIAPKDDSRKPNLSANDTDNKLSTTQAAEEQAMMVDWYKRGLRFPKSVLSSKNAEEIRKARIKHIRRATEAEAANPDLALVWEWKRRHRSVPRWVCSEKSQEQKRSDYIEYVKRYTAAEATRPRGREGRGWHARTETAIREAIMRSRYRAMKRRISSAKGPERPGVTIAQAEYPNTAPSLVPQLPLPPAGASVTDWKSQFVGITAPSPTTPSKSSTQYEEEIRALKADNASKTAEIEILNHQMEDLWTVARGMR